VIYWPYQASWGDWDEPSWDDWDQGLRASVDAHVSGIGDVTPLGLAVPGVGVQQLFDWNPWRGDVRSDGSRDVGSRGRRSGDWAGVAVVGAVVAIGVIGFLAFRHGRVAAGTIRGVRSAFREESSN
jgi:hypothetical protein